MRLEEWKLIEGISNKFGHTYSVSDYGNVRNNGTGRILSKRLDKRGYARANVAGKEFKVHRLVAEYFVVNPRPGEFNMVNHIDTVKTNNLPSNLEWCDHDYNMAHAVSNDIFKGKSKGERNPRAILTEKDVLEVWLNKLSAKEVSEKYKVSEGYSKILIGKRTWKHLIPVYKKITGEGNSYKKALVEPVRDEDFYFN